MCCRVQVDTRIYFSIVIVQIHECLEGVDTLLTFGCKWLIIIVNTMCGRSLNITIFQFALGLQGFSNFVSKRVFCNRVVTFFGYRVQDGVETAALRDTCPGQAKMCRRAENRIQGRSLYLQNFIQIQVFVSSKGLTRSA